MIYTIQRCRSHETASRPMPWEDVFSDNENTVMKKWLSTYRGPHPSGDEFRIVDTDGVPQVVTDIIVGPIY